MVVVGDKVGVSDRRSVLIRSRDLTRNRSCDLIDKYTQHQIIDLEIDLDIYLDINLDIVLDIDLDIDQSVSIQSKRQSTYAKTPKQSIQSISKLS